MKRFTYLRSDKRKPRKLSNKEIIKRKFRKFLYDNDALDKYEALVLSERYARANKYIAYKIRQNKANCLIDSAFVWPNDDASMWSRLNREWNEKIKEIKSALRT